MAELTARNQKYRSSIIQASPNIIQDNHVPGHSHVCRRAAHGRSVIGRQELGDRRAKGGMQIAPWLVLFQELLYGLARVVYSAQAANLF